MQRKLKINLQLRLLFDVSFSRLEDAPMELLTAIENSMYHQRHQNA